jgi:hypothetical protein
VTADGEQWTFDPDEADDLFSEQDWAAWLAYWNRRRAENPLWLRATVTIDPGDFL